MKRASLILTVFLLLASCAQTIKENPQNNEMPQVPTDNNEWQTFQTDAKAIVTETPITVDILTNQLTRPWGIGQLPDGSFIITEKSGRLVRFFDGEITTIEADFSMINAEGQGGLLDVVVDPQFEESRTIFLTGSVTYTIVMKAKLTPDLSSVEQLTVIYEALPAVQSVNHYGSRIALDEDGNLFVSTGDRQNTENRYRAQSLDNGHGKVLAMNQDGDSIIYAYGFRNPQGLALNQEGELYLSDMGPMGGDEIDRVEEFGNYGWPLVSYGKEYSGAPVGDGLTQLEGTIQPIYYWVPSIAPSGITFYQSDAIPEWQGNLFVGALAGQHLVRLKLEDGKVVGEERLLTDLGLRIRDVYESEDGSLMVISDDGQLLRLRGK